MRKLTLALTGAALFSGVVANAQTTIVDTIGNGQFWGLNGSDTNVRFLGDDPGSTRPAIEPKTGNTAGYVVIPINIGSASAFGGATSISNLSLDIVGGVRAPSGSKTTSNLDRFYGAFFNPNGQTLAGATQVSSFFNFDTTPAASFNNPAVGNGLNEILSGNVSGVSLNTGASYWLVLAPKAGLNSTNADDPNLLTLGVIANRINTQIVNSNASTSTAFGSTAQGKWSINGGSGNLTNAVAQSGTAQFFGVRLSTGVAAVPAPSSVATMFLGAIPGVLLLRRRRAAK